MTRITNNAVTKDVADVEVGPGQVNNNMCDNVIKTVDMDDEKTHCLSVIKKQKKTDRTDKI